MTPFRIPNIPVINAVLLGRHGTSDAYTFLEVDALTSDSINIG